MVLHFVLKNRERLGLEIPKTFEQTVQQSVERFCVDSDVFKKREGADDEGLFSWPHGKGRSHWAVRQPQTDNWLRAFVAKRQEQISKSGI